MNVASIVTTVLVYLVAWNRAVALLSFSTTTRSAPSFRSTRTTSPSSLAKRTSRPQRRPSFTHLLWGGYGVARNYTWTEEPFEIEVTVEVPPDTRAKDISFQALPQSIDLRLISKPTTTTLEEENAEELIVLDKTRKLRGNVQLDGTFWVISDSEDDQDKNKPRKVTVTIEKSIRGPRDDFDIVDYDWKGVYPDDDEEVSERHYEEPEELNVRQYAASLGVDIDNINMSMVDKTMFSSGLNMTRSTMDQLSKSGYMEEVTQQSDGTEFTINDQGEAVPFNRLGETIGKDELLRDEASAPPMIPFLDTSSPWNKQTVPVVDDELDALETKNGTFAKSVETRDPTQRQDSNRIPAPLKDCVTPTTTIEQTTESDPIEALTVKRLKEILREQGLKVGGSKQELRDRLRLHIQTMVKDQNAQS